MSDLTEQIKLFLNSEPPKGVAYVPGSLVEMLLATYAVEGRLDKDATELMKLCQIELDIAVAEKTGADKAFFAESADLVREVLKQN